MLIGEWTGIVLVMPVAVMPLVVMLVVVLPAVLPTVCRGRPRPGFFVEALRPTVGTSTALPVHSAMNEACQLTVLCTWQLSGDAHPFLLVLLYFSQT